MPRELQKVSHPSYVIEPPDILVIDALRVVPLPPYRLEPLDVIILDVKNTRRDEPLTGLFQVQPEGTVNLGLAYGTVRLAGLTIEEARTAITTNLREAAGLTNPVVQIALAQSRAMQQIRGEHLVKADGTVSLGVYGEVRVVGLTLAQAKMAIEEYLSRFLLRPEISLDVSGFNSKTYWVIFEGAGFGEQIIELPITGNETVLSAIGKVNGLPVTSSQKNIWVARPAPPESGCDQVLPVDWCGITRRGETATNYQILPGDRIFVQGDTLLTFNNALTKIVTPIERMFGVTLLGTATVHSFRSGGSTSSSGTGF